MKIYQIFMTVINSPARLRAYQVHYIFIYSAEPHPLCPWEKLVIAASLIDSPMNPLTPSHLRPGLASSHSTLTIFLNIPAQLNIFSIKAVARDPCQKKCVQTRAIFLYINIQPCFVYISEEAIFDTTTADGDNFEADIDTIRLFIVVIITMKFKPPSVPVTVDPIQTGINTLCCICSLLIMC